MTALEKALRGTGKAPIKLGGEWYVASNRYGAVQTGLHLGGLLVLLALATPLWIWLGPGIAAPLVIGVGALTYKLTIILHDCAHMTLFATRRYNLLVGNLVGFFLGSDFRQFQAQHFLHHRTYGKALDPQGRDYLGLQATSRAEICWHLLRPLVGYNLFKLVSFQPPAGERAVEKQRAASPRRRIGFVAGTLIIQASILAIATAGGTVWWNALLYPGAAATVALFLSQLRGFCEHVAPVPHGDESFVRTHQTTLIDRLFVYGLNFNFHVEHHLYPGVPSCHLPRLHKTYSDRFHSPQTLSPSILNTVTSRLAQCPN